MRLEIHNNYLEHLKLALDVFIANHFNTGNERKFTQRVHRGECEIGRGLNWRLKGIGN
jgi:hypothetical protein